MDGFVCKTCGNDDYRYIGFKNGQPYCRRCISFQGAKVAYAKPLPKKAPLNLHYSLSPEQASISEKIVANFKKGIDTLVYAVTGAGKTEISYAAISYAISKGLTVGFALPRKDVVIELFWRLKEALPDNKIVAVYGQHSFDLRGDVIILTTHQLYRYPAYFDLLVLDEIDAFPFKDNETLESFYKKSLRGHVVLMSATPSEKILKEYRKIGHEVLELRTRFHKRPIPIPTVKIYPNFFQKFAVLLLLKRFKKEGKPVLVFVSSIYESISLFRFVSFFVKEGNYVNSKREGREEIIGDFKKNKYVYLITTSVLERGVTIKNLQVVVMKASSEAIYTSSTLIQIAGRVGRKAEAASGEAIFLADHSNEEMKKAIDEIKFCNTFL